MAGAARPSNLIPGPGALRNARWIQALLRPRRDVLPTYKSEASGWVVAMRRAVLFLSIVIFAIIYGVLSAILPTSLLMGAAAPLAVIALLVIWALPDARSAPTRALGYAFAAFLLFMVLWPNYMAVAVAGLPWISMRRLIGLVLSGLLLISISTSKSFRSDIIAVLRASPWLGRLLIGYFVIQFLASVLSVAPTETIGRWINYTFTSTAVCFTAIWLFGPGGKPVDWFVNRMMLATFGIMVIGVFEARAQHVLWIDHIPSFLRIDDAVIQSLIAPHIRNWYRVVTTYTTPLAYGELLALLTPFVLYRLVNAKTWKDRFGLIAFDGFIFYSAVLSTARLSLVGFLAAHALCGLLWGIHRWRSSRSELTGVSLTLMYPAVIAAMAMAVMFVPALHVRVVGSGASAASTDARGDQFRKAVPVILKRPVLGYGLGQGAAAINWLTPDGFLTIDLGFVALAADIGVFGFLCYIGFLGLSITNLIRVGLRSPPSAYPSEFAIAVSLIVLITTRIVLAQTDNDPLFTILFGMSLARLYLANPKPSPVPGGARVGL